MRFFSAILLIIVLGGCVQSNVRTEVTRFNNLDDDAARGTIMIVAAEGIDRESLEFAAYKDIVAVNLRGLGFRPVEGKSADRELTLGYKVGEGERRTVTRPARYAPVSAYDALFLDVLSPRYRYRAGLRYYYQPAQTFSYTVFRRSLDVTIRDMSNDGPGKRVFEARAESIGRSTNLARVIPQMVRSVFANFPGRNGETVTIDLPLEDSQAPSLAEADKVPSKTPGEAEKSEKPTP